MDIYVNVVNQKLRIATNVKSFVSGSQNFVRFYFNLTEDWDDLSPFAQFCQNDLAYNVFLDDEHSVHLPPEITDGVCTMALYGFSGERRATTSCVQFTVEKNIIIVDENSTEVSQSLYDQLVKKVNDICTLTVSYNATDSVVEFISHGKAKVPLAYDEGTGIIDFLNDE